MVCRELGFRGEGATATLQSTFGRSLGSSFAMDDVACTGNEARLSDCRHSTSHNCGVAEIAGVRCSPIYQGNAVSFANSRMNEHNLQNENPTWFICQSQDEVTVTSVEN